MIADVRSQFASEAHLALRVSHGHHFASHAPPPIRRQQQSQKPQKRDSALSEMMEPPTPAPDPDAVLAQKRQKVATHNARMQARNTLEATQAPVETAAAAPEEEEEESESEDGK